ncbi:NAD(+)/NADH kinase [Dehalobacter sp. DCM]|uniref:NAD(+)/NADH kinase n=1 Tax=Dehalobacter sp. DCM TaxID=2907827 RepID=UPI00308217D9|nr:NAD(+)/NADH kinase [Dehalobacter sp. DCM]
MANRVGIWANQSRINTNSLIPQLINWFTGQGWETVPQWDEKLDENVDFILSLGGDGTVLGAAREASRFHIPVLGVNFGKLGFLCEIERGEIYTALKKVLRQEYAIEERLMLNVSYIKDGEKFQEITLNDVVFIRDNEDALVTLQVKLSGEPIASPPSDGLIIATPTGSTAYSLSAGGPVVSPDVQAVLITPLAAHALSSRPMVVSYKEKIDVILTKGNHARVTSDGKFIVLMNQGDHIQIETAPIRARFIRLGERSFPKVVREKLRDRWHE